MYIKIKIKYTVDIVFYCRTVKSSTYCSRVVLYIAERITMKRILLCVFVIFATLLNAVAQNVIVCAIGDWPPYTSQDDQTAKLLEIIVEEAFALEGYRVVYKYFPWKRSYEMVKNGEYDVTFPWNKTPEREQDFVFNNEPLIKDESVFFHLKSLPFEWKKLEDIKKYRVGVTIGWKQEEIYAKNGIIADAAPSEEMNFTKIVRGRVDVYQTSKVVGYATIRKMFTREEAALFTHHPKVVEINNYFVMFPKNNPQGKAHAAILDKGLRRLKKSGRYDAIIAEFLKN